ncbi:MAG: mucin-2 protein, partial [Marmoricola sp.]
AHLPIIDKPCAGTSGVESGLQPGAIRVYRAVCNNFPEVTSYGGRSNHGEHSTGKAIDIMTSDVELGNRIAEFLQAHATELDLFDVIWRQHIWTPVRASEGWRSMPSRGSETANHDDHVHVSIN